MRKVPKSRSRSLSSPPNYKFVTVDSIASFPKSEKLRVKTKYNQNNVSTLKKKFKIQKDFIIYKCIPMSNFSSSSKSSSTLVFFYVAMIDWNQSTIQIRHCTILRVKELLNGSKTRLLVLNADSEATVEIVMANISRAILERMVNLPLLTFQ